MIVGFTGTSRGMTTRQVKQVRQLLWKVDKIHLGDCIGADAQAHEEAIRLGVLTVGHPPDNDKYRAFCDYDEEREPRPYLIRNRDIVKEGIDGLIATPKDWVQPINLRGQGTWTTVRYARQANRRIWLILPDGQVKEENHG